MDKKVVKTGKKVAEGIGVGFVVTALLVTAPIFLGAFGLCKGLKKIGIDADKPLDDSYNPMTDFPTY